MATIDYMIASYGPYAASATGGNGFARDFLAGVAAMYSVPSMFPSTHTELKSPSDFMQCIPTWELCTNSNGLQLSWLSWPFYLRSRFTSSIGRVPKSEKSHPSHRFWLQIGRRPTAELLSAALMILTPWSDTCQALALDLAEDQEELVALQASI